MGRSRRQQRERAVSWTYAEWLKANPAPDYQALAKKWGGGGLTIPEAEWQKFNAAMQEWEARRKNRHLDGDDPTPREPAIVHPESIPGAMTSLFSAPSGWQSGCTSVATTIDVNALPPSPA